MNKYNSENVCKHNTISASVIANIRTLGRVASVFIGSVWCSFHFFFFFHKRLKNFIRNGSILKVYNDARSSLTSAVLICNSVWWKKKKKVFLLASFKGGGVDATTLMFDPLRMRSKTERRQSSLPRHPVRPTYPCDTRRHGNQPAHGSESNYFSSDKTPV